MRITALVWILLLSVVAFGQVADKSDFDEQLTKAQQGDAKAQCNLGLCYYKGEGVEKDPVEAAKWFRKAAEQGFASAQCNLGACYSVGDGVAVDKTEGLAWAYLIAATLEDGKQLVDVLEKELGSQEILAAKERAKEIQKIIEANQKQK